jgi:hypothetical protein
MNVAGRFARSKVFRDGRWGHASQEVHASETRLGEVPVPELDEIARDSQFEPSEITAEEFEAMWRERISRLRTFPLN